MKYMLITLCALLLGGGTFASVDTLRHYTPGTSTGSFSTTSYVLQVARFEPVAPGSIQKIRVGLGGTAGSVSIQLFDHEGGTAFPQFENNIITPITVTKSAGDTFVEVTLITPVLMDNNQFFVAISGMSSGVTLLHDQVTYPAPCASSSGGDYHWQFMKNAALTWSYGDYAFLIDVIIDYPTTTSPMLFEDVTASAGIDTNKSNGSIAWADLDDDTDLDLLLGGTLYQNNGNGTFTDITVQSGLSGNPRASAFIDMDNDGVLDILYVSVSDSADKCVVFMNDGQGNFTGSIISTFLFPTITGPYSLSIGDYNMDHYPDVFVTQLWGVYPNPLPNFLLRNNQSNSFQDYTAADMFGSSSTPDRRSRGSQWVDFDDDGDLDLFVVNYYLEKDELWRNDGTGELGNIINTKNIDVNLTGSSHGTGCDWMDYDNDGDLDLLVPQLAHPGFMTQYDHRGTTIYENSGSPNYVFQDMVATHGIAYEETHAGSAWGDVNNDGLVDVVTTTYYGCRYMDIHLQKPDHSYELKSFDYGIQDIVTGQDAAWVDYDNDGKLDLAGGKNNKIRLYRNVANLNSNWVELDIKSCTGNTQAIGARVWVYCGSDTYMQEVTAGRGQKMQKPGRLHFGLGNHTVIDSVVVRWPNGVYNKETVSGITANQINQIDELDCTISNVLPAVADFNLTVSPNPFNSIVNFSLLLSETAEVKLRIYDLQGRVLSELASADYPAGKHQLSWDPGNNRDISAGLYFYVLEVNGQRLNGKLIHQP